MSSDKVHLITTTVSTHTLCGRKTSELICVEWEDRTWFPTCNTCLRNFFLYAVPFFDKEDFMVIVNRVFRE